jgi:hypothetical protein
MIGSVGLMDVEEVVVIVQKDCSAALTGNVWKSVLLIALGRYAGMMVAVGLVEVVTPVTIVTVVNVLRSVVQRVVGDLVEVVLPGKVVLMEHA